MIQQTAIEWLIEQIKSDQNQKAFSASEWMQVIEQAKEMEREQRGYTKEDVLKAGEIGEINHHDYKHIVSLLDEAREINRQER